jgi:hypothetical protein
MVSISLYICIDIFPMECLLQQLYRFLARLRLEGPLVINAVVSWLALDPSTRTPYAVIPWARPSTRAPRAVVSWSPYRPSTHVSLTLEHRLRSGAIFNIPFCRAMTDL